MHKSPEDWKYERVDLFLNNKPLVWCALLQYLPFGLRNQRSPTLDKLERVSILFAVFNSVLLQILKIAISNDLKINLKIFFQSHLTDDVLGLPNLEDLGVKLNHVKDEMPWVLDPYRAFRYHTYFSLADRPVIHPLKPIDGFQERALEKELEKGSKLVEMLGLKYNE